MANVVINNKEKLLQELTNRFNTLTNDEYDILNMLSLNVESETLIKILDAWLSKGESGEILSLYDFKQMLTDQTYQKQVINNLGIEQSLLEKEIQFEKFKKSLEEELPKDLQNLIGNLKNSIKVNSDDEIINNIADEKIQEMVYEIFGNLEYYKETNILQYLIYTRMIKYINSVIEKEGSTITYQDFFKQLFNINRIPLQYDEQILTKSDLDFMNQNNLTETEMKKIKSLVLYSRFEDTQT